MCQVISNKTIESGDFLSTNPNSGDSSHAIQSVELREAVTDVIAHENAPVANWRSAKASALGDDERTFAFKKTLIVILFVAIAQCLFAAKWKAIEKTKWTVEIASRAIYRKISGQGRQTVSLNLKELDTFPRRRHVLGSRRDRLFSVKRIAGGDGPSDIQKRHHSRAGDRSSLQDPTIRDQLLDKEIYMKRMRSYPSAFSPLRVTALIRLVESPSRFTV